MKEIMQNRFKCMKNKVEKLYFTLHRIYKIDKEKIPNFYDHRHMSVSDYMKMAAGLSENSAKWKDISFHELCTSSKHSSRFAKASGILNTWSIKRKSPGYEGILLERGFDKSMSTPRNLPLNARFFLFINVVCCIDTRTDCKELPKKKAALKLKEWKKQRKLERVNEAKKKKKQSKKEAEEKEDDDGDDNQTEDETEPEIIDNQPQDGETNGDDDDEGPPSNRTRRQKKKKQKKKKKTKKRSQTTSTEEGSDGSMTGSEEDEEDEDEEETDSEDEDKTVTGDDSSSSEESNSESDDD